MEYKCNSFFGPIMENVQKINLHSIVHIELKVYIAVVTFIDQHFNTNFKTSWY